jgi:hypothetical protein
MRKWQLCTWWLDEEVAGLGLWPHAAASKASEHAVVAPVQHQVADHRTAWLGLILRQRQVNPVLCIKNQQFFSTLSTCTLHTGVK